MKIVTFFITVLLVFTIPNSAMSSDKVNYPEDYRSWTHAKSMVIQPGHPLENPFQGIHHVYVNELAAKGLKSSEYADGAMFVFDLLNYTETDNTLQEGSRKLVGVMLKQRSKYHKTGGWGFEAFAGDSKSKRIVKDGGSGCFNCHTQRKGNDYVFTTFRK